MAPDERPEGRLDERREGRKEGKSGLAPYPPIAHYGFISDCHSMALVGLHGSIDWCCMPRVDSGSCFGRLLDWRGGGHCSIAPRGGGRGVRREYLEGTMVLVTTFVTSSGEARLYDCFSMRRGGREEPHQELLRVVEGVRGTVDFEVDVAPRFDYGALRPWLRRSGPGCWAAIGGNDGLLISCDEELEMHRSHDLRGRFQVQAGRRVRLVVRYRRPELLDAGSPRGPDAGTVDERLEATIHWWRRWTERMIRVQGPDGEGAVRSALVLKALSNAPTGAIAAAATTSLPERTGGARNWDYRFSWIRDSAFSVRSLALAGAEREADGFRRFMQRTSAGSAHELQIMYGVGGERRLTELELDHLEGYRRSRPVRTGNGAALQLQLDAYGELVQLAWNWHRRGHSPDDDYWRFLVDLVEVACERWTEPDRGIWEVRGDPRHFVHSKVMCWLAADRGVALAEESQRKAPVAHWRRVAAEIRESIEANGIDEDRGCFTQSYGSRNLDAALLLIPSTGFCRYDDPRMVGTVAAIRQDLEEDGLVKRYDTAVGDDGLGVGEEGRFLACTFWLAECLAGQGRAAEARQVFDRVAATANDLGLFAEEYDLVAGELLGNFPQGLTHLSHLAAALSLAAGGKPPGSGQGAPL